MTVTAVILTHNEEQHLERCLKSLEGLVSEVLIADCYSTDATLDIARRHGARIVQQPWVNYATQFNWAIEQVGPRAGWLLRIDADEYLTPELREQFRQIIQGLPQDVDGVFCSRRMTFQRRMIRHGGVFPVRVLRLFRNGRGRCEMRLMDEHIKVDGRTVEVPGELIDDNLNSLTWWTEKHNKYASREAVDLLNIEFRFMPLDTIANLRGRQQAGVKRWLKEEVYTRLPTGLRALVYFLYRYVVRFGFLDGQEGTAFHVLQGFWYRYLVDAKIIEVKRHMARHQVDVVTAIHSVLGIRLSL